MYKYSTNAVQAICVEVGVQARPNRVKKLWKTYIGGMLEFRALRQSILYIFLADWA